MVRKGLIEKAIFGKRLAGGDGVSHADTRGQSIQAQATAHAKALGRSKAGTVRQSQRSEGGGWLARGVLGDDVEHQGPPRV